MCTNLRRFAHSQRYNHGVFLYAQFFIFVRTILLQAVTPPMQHAGAARPGSYPWERFSSSVTANRGMEKWLLYNGIK
jgi:hypothetical protein